MSRILAFAAALTLFSPAAPALAQPTPDAAAEAPAEATAPAGPEGVEVEPLAAPDAFTTIGRQTGLPQDLWRGASVDTLNTVLPKLSARRLSPAATSLARRVLATGAIGPRGVGADREVLAARANALMALGEPVSAAAILSRAPGLDSSPELARSAAESALLAGDDARACAIADALKDGREDAYWLRLRAFCQVLAGQPDEAQLTFELAQAQTADAAYGRLMGALLGGGSPGAASLRNGLDFALSRKLELDLSTAKPAPLVAAAIASIGRTEPEWKIPEGDSDRLAAVRALAGGQPISPELVSRLLDEATKVEGSARAPAQAAALIVAAYTRVAGPDLRGRLAALTVPEGKTPAGRNLALAAAAQERLVGETAMLALWTCLEAPQAGVSIADRARIIQALREAGLDTDARNFAVEGLLALS